MFLHLFLAAASSELPAQSALDPEPTSFVVELERNFGRVHHQIRRTVIDLLLLVAIKLVVEVAPAFLSLDQLV